ncbi:MAG TPA: PTS sugar transporter subunit IIA [Dongiaceae bacterium]|jgi:PTS system nitrogen regulatory IIA component|nr:PTS sugar transporter subunit IIA [Dongiaceae bacterium]
MSYQLLNLEEVAAYLHLSPTDILQRVKYQEIPSERRGDRIMFSKGEIDDWASQRILHLPERRLAEYHQQSLQAVRQLSPAQAVLPALLQPDFIHLDLDARTRASVLRELVRCAEATGRVNDPAGLLASVEAREALGATAMNGGWAVPHPRQSEPYLLEASFLVVARTIQGIHFGAPDGEPTRWFFLLCCQDGALHLFALARLCFLFRQTDLLAELEAAPDAATICEALIAGEQGALQSALPGNRG